MTSPYISREIERRIRQAAQDRCGYCLSQQRYVFAPLEIEHIIPRALGGANNVRRAWVSAGWHPPDA
jgi:5-methylcytosine-specific restriction endonuclease McrA